MRPLPFLLQQIFIDLERRQRINSCECIFGAQFAQHAENSGVLHSRDFSPNFVLSQDVVERDRVLEIRVTREQAGADVSANVLQRECVNANLNAVAPHQLLPQLLRV